MKPSHLFLLLAGLCGPTGLSAQVLPDAALYGTGQWDADSLGNHRIVVRVDRAADAVRVDAQWRRRDQHPDSTDIVVVDAATGQRITNVARYNVSRERADIVFQPKSAPGDYYIYYLRNVTSGSRYYPTVVYPPFESTADAAWLKRHSASSVARLPQAKVVQYQAINDFNSFYPMELIATAAEKKQLLKRHAGEPYLLFPEDRRRPIRMTSDIPAVWTADHSLDTFTGEAERGEYYVFQLGLWNVGDTLRNVRVSFSPLVDTASGQSIAASAATCFNTEGVDVTGTVFRKQLSVSPDRVQALWLGTMVPEQLPAGAYSGTVTVSADNVPSQSVAVTLNVSDRVIANHGDDEPWRHSRLRWLNSQIGEDDELVAPFSAIEISGRTLSILGRSVTLDATGLPASIDSRFADTQTHLTDKATPILAAPMQFDADGGDWRNLDFRFTKRKEGAVAWRALNENDNLLMELEGELEADGCMTYDVTLVAKHDAQLSDIALQTLLNPGIAQYTMGLGQKGGFAPKSFSWTWNVEKNQDALWLGRVNAGLQLRFYDDTYERPLNTNFYHQKPLRMPESWQNGGRGGIRFAQSADGSTRVTAYSGERTMKQGDCSHYNFSLLITPFKPIDTDKHWRDRYYHQYDFVDRTKEFGATVINIHHATAINPFINYPFLRPKEMKAYIDAAHALDMQVKIYNTVRELSNSCVELFALRSLGDELFAQGKGGGFSWLQEHLDQDYIGAWFVPQLKDAAIVNTGVSRWHNYYMEGLDWLVKNVGIDGLYIDDLAFDRTSMKRVRKILTRTNPSAMIDLHSANQFNPSDGFANSANLYLEHFPYLDRIWFGEYFDYNLPPDYWLVEVSGIPYGTMGEMLWEGGNKWRGMLYGITARNPGYGVDNRPLWQFWDSFGMAGSELIGWWADQCPVQTHREQTLASVYRHKSGSKALIAVATWEPEGATVSLDIDWKALGIDPAKATLHAPAIADYQSEATWRVGDPIEVPAGKGLLIVVE